MFASFRPDVINRRRLPLLCCLVAFIVTFVPSRTIVGYIRHASDRDAPRNVRVGEGHGPPHIHHVVCGAILVTVRGVTMVTLVVNGGQRAVQDAISGTRRFPDDLLTDEQLHRELHAGPPPQRQPVAPGTAA